MTLHRLMNTCLIAGLVTTLAACGGGFSGIGSGDSGWFGGRGGVEPSERALDARSRAAEVAAQQLDDERKGEGSIWDLFTSAGDPNTTVEVNKYIWNAALDVLNFLPVQTVDPFTGVIVTGYGTPPGGGRAYRATVYVQDPALDARSLKVALQTRGGGAVSRETAKAVEDAILTRARQLRVRDSKL